MRQGRCAGDRATTLLLHARNAHGEKATILAALLTCLLHDIPVSQVMPNGLHQARHPLLAQVLVFEAALIADIVHACNFVRVAA
jgi:elongation factor 3